MTTFDSYLQERGFGTGTKLSPSQASAAYNEYQSSLNTPAWSFVASKQSEPTQESSGSNPIMGAATGIGMKYATGGGGGGGGSGGFGGSWAGVPQGALAGYMSGDAHYRSNPDMTNKKDGFGKHYPDMRSHVGGAFAGGVMGYYGLGSLAGPVVTASHPIMEPTTRWLINAGDSWGDAGGAMFMAPVGSVLSGKYSYGELAKGALLGPLDAFF